MKRAMIFPGQGSQKIGMGKDLADTYEASKKVFEEIDDALNMSLSSMIWNGSIEELTLTENAQPALMATSIAALAALETEGFELNSLSFVAGHSLGEYSALCAVKSISLQDTARLLRQRGLAMQSCVKSGEGAMAAILGLTSGQIDDLLHNFSGAGICQIANDNDPQQVVISGHKSEVDSFIELAKKNGARRALPLNVSAPFHCKIMAPAARVMQEALAEIKISTPIVPVVMNTEAKSVVNSEFIRKQLVKQVVERVRWRETIQFLAGQGVTNFYEVGVGKVLSGMVKRITDGVNTSSISSSVDVSTIKENL